VIGSAAVDAGELAGPGVPFADEARLRRMDRFGRAGFLAGSLALRAAGYDARPDVDPRAGLVFGSALGCRDANTRHAVLVSQTAQPEDLSPSLFTQTVHNSVVGELSIEWRLGGVSELLVSGRTAGLEAILRGAAHVSEGEAERSVAAGAEGIHPEMERAWNEERPRYGGRAEDVACTDGAASVVLARSGTAAARATLRGGVVFFEPDAGRVASRLASFVAGIEKGRGVRARLVLASPALDGAFEDTAVVRAGLDGRAITGPAAVERFSTAGPRAVADLIAGGGAGLHVVVVRDPGGPVAALALEISPRSA